MSDEEDAAPGKRPDAQPREELHTAAGPDVVDVADWSAPPLGSVKGRLDVPSGRLASISAGQPGGDSIVLVPGVTGSKEDFSLMMPRLSQAGYRVLSFDLAGQYESADAGPERLVPPRAHYDYALFVDDLICILEARDSPSHVLGYSFAGIVAQLTLVQRPDLFSSLTLLSSPPQLGKAFRGVPLLGALSAHLNGRLQAALVIMAIRCNIKRVPPSRLRFVRHRFAQTRGRSVRDVFELMQRSPDLRDAVRRAPVPKLVAVGEHDVWPLALHRRFAAEIDARLSVYPGGHSPCETSPDELTRDLLRLIRP